MLFELLAKSPTFFGGDWPQTQARPPLRRRCLSQILNTRARAVLHDRLRHPNFHPMVADPPGVLNIQSVDLASGVATAAGLPS